MSASRTWIWTASTPRSSIRAWASSPARCTTRHWRPRCAAPTIAGSPITASPIPTACSAIAMLPMQSVDHAIAEMRFARRELGFRGGFIRPNPYNNRMLHDPAYDPLWSAAGDLDFSIGIHEGGNSGMPTVGIDRFEGARRAAHHLAHDGDDARLHEHDLRRRLRTPSKIARRLSRIRRRLGGALARPHGSAFRRSGLQRFRSEDAPQRPLPA